jgi:hypothetical protein
VPQTAFNFFAAEQWASLRGELGTNAAPQDISRLIGERWNKSSEGERAPYVAMAQVRGLLAVVLAWLAELTQCTAGHPGMVRCSAAQYKAGGRAS